MSSEFYEKMQADIDKRFENLASNEIRKVELHLRSMLRSLPTAIRPRIVRFGNGGWTFAAPSVWIPDGDEDYPGDTAHHIDSVLQPCQRADGVDAWIVKEFGQGTLDKVEAINSLLEWVEDHPFMNFYNNIELED